MRIESGGYAFFHEAVWLAIGKSRPCQDLRDSPVRVEMQFAVVDAGTLLVDLPLLPLGAHQLRVVDGGQSDSLPLTVVVPAAPRLEVGSGDPFNPLNAQHTYRLAVAGEVGSLHYVLFSTSNLPSNVPLVRLGIGNGFSQLDDLTLLSIPSDGYVDLPLPIGAIGGQQVLYLQQLCSIP